MNELNRLYEAIHKSWNGKIDKDFRMSLNLAGTDYPLRIDGKDLYLPTSEALNKDSDKKVYFHPLCENILSKETEVFKLVRRLVSIRLLSLFRDMIVPLFDIAAKEPKKSWNQKVRDVVYPLKKVKRSVRDEVFNLFAKMSVEIEDNVDNRFIHIKTTKGGKTAKAHAQRVYYKAKPSYPFYDAMVRARTRYEGEPATKQIEVNNIPISMEGLGIAIHLFDVILFDDETLRTAEYESVIPVAARFTAFMSCYVDLAEQINYAQNMFRADFDKQSVFAIDLSWHEMMEEAPEFYRQVPELDYNSHNVYNEPEESAAAINSGMSSLLSISGATTTQPSHMVANVTNVGNTAQTANTNQARDVRNINGIDYDFTIPQMTNGDRYQRSEVDQTQQRVLHFIVDAMNQPAIYVCTRMGTFIQRQGGMQQMQQPMGGYVNYGQQQPVYGYQQPQQPMYGYQQQQQPLPSPLTAGEPIQPFW